MEKFTNSKQFIEFCNNENLQNLIQNFGINTKRHKIFQNLIQLQYDQLKSPINSFTNICRALILEIDEKFIVKSVVSKSMTRFFDYDSQNSKNFDFSSYKAYEKKDGSIMNLYFYNDCWNVSTKSIPDARGGILGKNKTFNDLFFEILKPKVNLDELPKDFQKFTFTFEMCFNQDEMTYLVKHKTNEEFLQLIAIQNNETFEDMDDEYFAKFNEIFSFGKIIENASIKNLHKLNPTEIEGYVFVDKNFNRVKVKSTQYEMIGQLKNCDEKNKFHNNKILTQIILQNDYCDFLEKSKYNHLKDEYSNLKDKISKFKKELEILFKNNLDKSGKELFLALNNHKHSQLVMSQQRNFKDFDFDEYFSKLKPEYLLKTLE